MDKSIHLPESAVIPFNMAEYSINLESEIKKEIDEIVKKIVSVKSVKKMNKMLLQCKNLIQSLKFNPLDSHH
jgi:hypothetical protein